MYCRRLLPSVNKVASRHLFTTCHRPQKMVTKVNFDLDPKEEASEAASDRIQVQPQVSENFVNPLSHQFSDFSINFEGQKFNLTLEKACFTYPQSNGIEITCKIEDNFDAKEIEFIDQYFYKNIDPKSKCLVTYADSSYHEVKNRKLAIDKMKILISKIRSLNPEKVKNFEPFIGSENKKKLPEKWQDSAYVNYGPYHKDMEQAFNWEIYPGMGKKNDIERFWHDNRSAQEIDADAKQILRNIDYSKRFGKLGEIKLNPVILQE